MNRSRRSLAPPPSSSASSARSIGRRRAVTPQSVARTIMPSPSPSRRRRRRSRATRIAFAIACVACATLACARARGAHAFDDAWLDGIDDDEAAGAPGVARDDGDVDDGAYASADVEAFMDAFDDDDDADDDAGEAAIRAMMKEMDDEIQTTPSADEANVEYVAVEHVERGAGDDDDDIGEDDEDAMDDGAAAMEEEMEVVPEASVVGFGETFEVVEADIEADDARDVVDVDIVDDIAENIDVDAEVVGEAAEEDVEESADAEDDVDDASAAQLVATPEIEGVNEENDDAVDAVDDEPSKRRGLLGSIFSKFGAADEETSAEDAVGVVAVETEEPEFVEEPAIPQVSIVSVDEEEFQAVETTSVPVPGQVTEIPRAESAKATEAVSDEQNEETTRRKLLEAQQQAAMPSNPNRAAEPVYVGNYWKRANPYHKGPRVKVIDA